MRKFNEIPGFISWQETFYEVTTLVHDIIGHHANARDHWSGLFKGIETQGSIWLRDLCITITYAFEEEYKDEDWSQTDFFDSVWNFTTKQLSEL